MESDPPAITISTRISGSDIRWKGEHKDIDTSYSTDIIKTVCNNVGDMNATLSCINDKTFNLTEVVEKAQCRNENLKDLGFWDEDLSYAYFGKLLTLHESYKIGTSWFQSLDITLNKGQKYVIWIHDNFIH